jgi:hypothetical protein
LSLGWVVSVCQPQLGHGADWRRWAAARAASPAFPDVRVHQDKQACEQVHGLIDWRHADDVGCRPTVSYTSGAHLGTPGCASNFCDRLVEAVEWAHWRLMLQPVSVL